MTSRRRIRDPGARTWSGFARHPPSARVVGAEFCDTSMTELKSWHVRLCPSRVGGTHIELRGSIEVGGFRLVRTNAVNESINVATRGAK